jgi:VanZ family protein
MTRNLLRVTWYWGPLLAYAVVIYYLSSLSNPPIPFRVPYGDKVLHAIEYAGFGALMCRSLALGGEGLSPPLALWASVLLGALYGTTDELHQAFVPHRQADLADLAADVLGSMLGAGAYRWAVLWRRASASQPKC